MALNEILDFTESTEVSVRFGAFKRKNPWSTMKSEVSPIHFGLEVNSPSLNSSTHCALMFKQEKSNKPKPINNLFMVERFQPLKKIEYADGY